MIVRIKSVSGVLPAYETSGSSGMDVKAHISKEMIIMPGDRELIPTGLSIELPHGFEAQIRARSGLAVKYGIGLVNGIGTIDSDYRGEIKIPMINWGKEPFTIRNGDRIAQLIISKYERIDWQLVEMLDDTDRGTGGFGHTGV